MHVGRNVNVKNGMAIFRVKLFFSRSFIYLFIFFGFSVSLPGSSLVEEKFLNFERNGRKE